MVADKVRRLLAELEATRVEYAERLMPADVARTWAAKAEEAERLQETGERKMSTDYSRTIDPANIYLPAPAQGHGTSGSVAGYITLGQAVASSDAVARLVDAGMPRGQFPLYSTKGKTLVEGAGGKWFVPLSRSERETFEQKAIPTLGAGVLLPDRIPVVPQVSADDRLRLRDVLTVSRTSSSSVEYLREESFTRAALAVAATVPKPEAALEYTVQNAPVLTIAVWIPVTVQMLADMGQLQGLIDGRLRYDVRKEEEERIMYGAGGTTDFAGLCTIAGTQDIATADNRVTAPTLIDDIRVGMTEVRVAGYEPNAVLLHSIDYEGLVLAKGTDDHYLAQVFPTADGGLKIWGISIVETVAAEENAGNPTEERNLVVGDFRRGATLFIREDLGVQLGMKGDQFVTNERTILAEERAAFAVTAPAAFAVLTTQASST